MISVYRATSTDPAFIKLVALLDKELAIMDGDEHSFYNQFNQIHNLNHVIVLKERGRAIACGAIKVLTEEAMEVKRMFVLKERRGQGFAGLVLEELEKWMLELGFIYSRLETGKRQPEAIALYKKKGYSSIHNYGQYAEVPNSLCFEKKLDPD